MTSDELLLLLQTEHCDHKKSDSRPFCEGCLQEYFEEYEEDLLESVALAIEEADFGIDQEESSSIVRSFKK